MAKFRGRDFVTDQAYSREELLEVIHLAVVLKELHREMHLTPFLPGRHLGMIFDDPSTRTRVSFETGMTVLGATPSICGPGRCICRAAKAWPTPGACSRASSTRSWRARRRWQCCASFAEAASVPVINGEAGDWDHPIQSVSDALTILEYGGRLEGETMAWLGHGDCMCNSVALTLAPRDEREPGHSGALPALGQRAQLVEDNCREDGTRLHVTDDPEEVVADADVPAPDTSLWWLEDSAEYIAEVRRKMQPYQVNEALWAKTKPGAHFMHCLPAVRGDEVTMRSSTARPRWSGTWPRTASTCKRP